MNGDHMSLPINIKIWSLWGIGIRTVGRKPNEIIDDSFNPCYFGIGFRSLQIDKEMEKAK